MRRVVVESPYAGEVDRNVAYARRAVRDCLEHGEAPIASHLLFTQPGVLRDDVPEERALGMRAGWAWLPAAHALVVYIDYGISAGMRAAMAKAEALGLRVEHRKIGRNP